MSNFNDLFEDFIGGFKDLNKETEKLINLLNSISEKQNGIENIHDDIESSLGEPDILENFEKDGIFYTKMIWKTAAGLVIKTIMDDTPFNEKTLEEKLQDALNEEDYELAAKIRDLIEKDKKEG